MPTTAARPVTAPSAAQVDAALDAVVDPCSVAAGTPLSLRDMGLVRGWSYDDGRLRLVLCVTGPGCTFVGGMAATAERALLALPDVAAVDVVVDPDVVWDPSWQSPAARAALDDRRRRAVVDLGLRPRMWGERDAPSPQLPTDREAAA